MQEATPSRLYRLVEGKHRSGLELIVGPARYVDEMVRNSLAWIGMAGGGTIGLLLAGSHLGVRRDALALVVLYCVVMAAVIPVMGRRGPPVFFPLLAISAGALCGVLVWLSGPNFGVSAALPPAYVAAASVFFSRRTTAIAATLAIVTFGAVVLVEPGYPRPWARIVLIAATTLATTFVISRFVDGIERLSRSERVLHEQVASARVELEARVTAQVDEIERLGKLRRFLSPQVADAVLSSGGENMLATHRRQIAVIFVDLRGFTGFSAVAEPEDVVEVLTEFYEAVGVIVKRLGATVGGFAGDGVMAYFNDPFPCDDPPGRALEMATSLREPMARLGERWRQRGFVIGYGAGIAYGYATLGTIGFEDRTDYTPIGSVVNLASRLCDEAPPGEVLLDGRAHEAVRDNVKTEPMALELKGFNGPVAAFRLTL